MADRIGRPQLEKLAAYLNKITGHAPEPWSRVNGKNVANPGTFYIDGAYGGFSLEQMSKSGTGGVRDVLRTGHIKARPLYERIAAYIQGIEEDGLIKRNPRTKKKTAKRKSRSRFTHEHIRSPSAFAPGSIRTVTRGRGKKKVEVRIGCPTGKYNKKTRRCKVGTRAVSILKPKTNPVKKPMTFRVFMKKGNRYSYLNEFESAFDTDYTKSKRFYKPVAIDKARKLARQFPQYEFGVSDGKA